MSYWNHNTAYHPWLLRNAVTGRALDVGCGDGLLLEKLAAAGFTGVGLEPEPAIAHRATERLAGVPGIEVQVATFAEANLTADSFDSVFMVASLHHMPLTSSFSRARDILRPGGVLLIVGLSANRTAFDWAISGLKLPLAWIGSRMHRERRDIGVPLAPPEHSLREVKAAAAQLLPQASFRPGLYFRYLMKWAKR